MPIQKCIENSKHGFKWGKAGKCFTYNKNDTSSKKIAKEKALKQGIAIETSRHKNI